MSETTPSVPETAAAPAPASIPLPVANSGGMSFSNTNTLAIVSLVASILGGFAIVGIITGHMAINQIKRTGENGRGLALAGLIVGYIAVAASLIFLVLWVTIFAAAAANGTLVTTPSN